MRQICARLVGLQHIQPGDVICSFAYLCPRMVRSSPDHGQVYFPEARLLRRRYQKATENIFTHLRSWGHLTFFVVSCSGSVSDVFCNLKTKNTRRP